MKLSDWQLLQRFSCLLLSATALLTCTYAYAQQESNGEKLFSLHCAACHTFKEDGIGPQLGGLKGVLDQKYLTAFINSPKAMIDAKNPRALDKYKRFGTIMPNFNHLKAAEIQELIAFILEKPAPKVTASAQKKGLANPIPTPIPMANISLNLKKVIQFPATNNVLPRTRINKMGVHPITKESIVADSQGKIYILNAKNEPEVFFDVTNHFPKFTNVPGLATGLGSFAFHPDFAQNGLFYTTHTEPNNQTKADFAYADSIPVKLQWIINEWVIDNKTARTVTGKPREILRVNVVSQIHGMQEITFNPYAKAGDEDYGLMYVCIGDGGAVEQGYPFIPKRKNHVWGKVLRIDLTGRNSKNGQYGIPKSNPIGRFGLDEIYAAGFRNPNRISWTKEGKTLVSNIGQHEIESLYLLKPGKNYGWPDREGTFLIDSTGTINSVFPLPANDAQFGYTYPVAQFDHDEGNAIMGGFGYIGNQVPELTGKYIFGDVVKGRVFYVNLSEIKEGSQATIHEFPVTLDHQPTTLKELCKANKVDFRIGQDASGELYIFTRSDGMMYKITK
ncbi:hypothetical protein GCM10027592_09450 [Spirosoma flavus]